MEVNKLHLMWASFFASLRKKPRSPRVDAPAASSLPLEDSTASVETADYEIVLGARQLAGLLFLLIATLAVVFSTAYLMGKKETQEASRPLAAPHARTASLFR